MTTNIVTAKFNNTRRATTRPITQYDYGQILRIEGIELPATYEVDFSNNEHTGDSKPQLGSASGVHIPEEYIKTGKDIYAFVYLHTGAEDGETFYWIKIPNELRPMRTNEEPTPEEQSVITETIAALNAGVKTVEDIAEGMDAQIETALQEAKESGEFDGKDGVSPEISVEEIEGGHRVTITDASGETQVDIMNGADGADGADGINGVTFTPEVSQSGVISWTNDGGLPNPDSVNIKGAPGEQGERGLPGQDGAPGEDGVSPVVTVEEISGGHQVTIVDAEGTRSFEVLDGAEGQTGAPGAAGADGYSPTATVNKTGNTAIITITDKNGTTTASVSDGADGAPGAPGDDGISPTVTVTDIPGGHRITITDATGAHSFDVMDGDAADAPVQDVQVNGTSVLDAQGVANVPVVSGDVSGVVRVNNTYGIALQSSATGMLRTYPATNAEIKHLQGDYRIIPPAKMSAATFYGLAAAANDTTQSQSSNAVGTYTDSAKSAIHEMLNGSVSVSGTTPSITALPGIRYVCGEVSTLDITLPASGIVDVVFESGSTATVLNVTGVTWPDWFNPNALAANTTYELNIMDGLGVVGMWM